ncbi:PilN domain-containing protein [bacterium]|nr:PilN domain-containing protein [candidate division CSSED10-310 bacterium]
MIKINMLPHERKKTSIVTVELVAAGSLLLVLLVGVAIWWHYLNTTIKERIATVERKQKTVEELQIIINQVLKYEKDRNTLQTKLNTIDNLKKNQKGPVRLLDELNRRLPEQIWLTRLQTAGTLITLRGFSLSQTAIGDFMSALDASPYFNNVKLKISTLRKLANHEIYEFELDFITEV